MASEKEADADVVQERELDAELSDVLIAISVITRRLAMKILEKGESTE